VSNAFLLGGSIAGLTFVLTIIAIVAPKARNKRRRKALQQILEQYHQSGIALIRYIMLNRRCSEEVAYQRLAAFVKKHTSFDDFSDIDRMLADDRQSLIDKAQQILVSDPDAIDKI
jgi:hypothetical protein